MPIAELFADEEKNSDVYNLIDKNIERKLRKGIVTDMKKGYDVVMSNLKFDAHQYCYISLQIKYQKINSQLFI